MIRAILLHLVVSLPFLGFSIIAPFERDSSGASSINFLELSATASSKIIHFQWSVEFEQQGDYFVIEKSVDNEIWTEVSRVKSIGDHKETHTYEISEINFVESPTEYFRVVRIDQDGQTEVMDRVDVNQPVLSNMLLIPVPKKVNKLMTLSYDSMIWSKGTIRVYNEDAEIISEKNISLSEGYNRLTLNISGYEKGRYLVTIEDDFGNKLSRSFIVHGKRRA